MEILSGLAIACVLWYGGYKVIEGKIVDFTNDFEIMVQTDKKTEVFNSGEVSFNY